MIFTNQCICTFTCLNPNKGYKKYFLAYQSFLHFFDKIMFKSTSTIIHPIQYCLSMKITCTFFFRIPLFITSSSFFFKKLLDIKKNPSYLYYTNVSLYVNSTIPFSGMKSYIWTATCKFIGKSCRIFLKTRLAKEKKIKAHNENSTFS